MEEEIGTIIHYYSRINVGILELSHGELKVGEKIHIKGKTTDFSQAVESLQIEHQNVPSIKKGESAGLRVNEQVREGDKVFRVTEG
jgi:translation elongation factor EF-1alpha